MAPKSAPKRVSCGRAIGCVIGRRAQDCGGKAERQSDPPPAINQICDASLAAEACGCEQPRQQEHQRHQAYVLPGAEQVEAEKALAIDDWKRDPAKGLRVERKRCLRLRSEVWQNRMKRDHNRDNDGAKVVERDIDAI